MLLSYLLPLLLPIPIVLGRRIPALSPYINLVVYVSSLGLLSVWGLLISIALGPTSISSSINYYTARSFYYFTSPLLGIRLHVEGEEHIINTSPAVLVGNHQSMLDILYLGRIFPKRAVILAKKSLRLTPLLGQYMTLSNALFIDRKDPASAIASLSAAAKDLKTKGLSLWVFPEGTRTLKEENTLRQFKRGAFHVAIDAGVPIVPVVCENYWRLYHPGYFSGGDLRIKVLPPIDTTSLTAADVAALASRTHEAMTAALREISRSPTNTAPISPALEPLRTDSSLASSVLKEVKEASAAAPEPEPAVASAPVETAKEAVATEEAEPQAPSTRTGSSISMAESWTADEEEENGAVLVGRPKHE